MVCPIISAYELHQAWPEADFQVVPDAGHASFETGITAALLAATDHFKSLH
jgi:proline iminopeptidase